MTGLSFEERQQLRLAVSEGVKESIPVPYQPLSKAQLREREIAYLTEDCRVLGARVDALQRDVWNLRRQLKEQHARADLWRHRAVTGRKAA